MIYRVAICDDEQRQIEDVEAILLKWAGIMGHVCRICTFPSGEAFLFAYEEDNAYDILLLDVKMRNISGIDLARRIRQEDDRAEIIFLTSYFEFAGEGYDVDALHYLLKPVSEEKLIQVLDKAAEKLAQQPPHVVITCERSTIKLYEAQILYVESFLHYISIHTTEGEIELPLARGKYDEINRAYISYM